MPGGDEAGAAVAPEGAGAAPAFIPRFSSPLGGGATAAPVAPRQPLEGEAAASRAERKEGSGEPGSGGRGWDAIRSERSLSLLNPLPL